MYLLFLVVGRVGASVEKETSFFGDGAASVSEGGGVVSFLLSVELGGEIKDTDTGT